MQIVTWQTDIHFQLYDDWKSKQWTRETPFSRVMSADIAQFVHQRSLCNFPASTLEAQTTLNWSEQNLAEYKQVNK